MRIAVSCRSLEYESGGVKEYLISLLSGLFEIDKRNTYVLFHSQKRFMGLFPGAEEVSLDCSNRLIFDWLKLPGALRASRIDVAFFPSSNMPPRVGCPCVATMHDLGYFHTAYRMYKWSDTLYMKRAMAYTARRADRLLAISGHTKKDLMEILNVPERKIVITHEAADAMYHADVPDADVEAFRQRHGLSRPFLLYTGNISPRKNLRTLLEAFTAVKDRLDVDIVVTGGMSWSDAWEGWVDSLGLADRVRRLGHVEREDMPALYRSCLAYAFPSLFEGFGLPVLEAQACGAPVICSTATSLPEVAGDGAYMVDPHDVDGMSRALVEVATNESLRAALVEKGRANAARFSWLDTARKTLDAFEQVHQEK